jgi:hypothetical protein
MTVPRWYLGLIVFGFVVLAIGGALFVAQTAKNAEALRSGLIQGCEENGNPLRAAVRSVLQDQVDQSRAGDLERFFPQIPPDELKTLIEEANAKRLRAIHELAPVDCAAIYSK